MTDPVDIIIIRGAPGSGKSQTAKSLSRYFPNGVRLEVDTIRQMVISVNWTNQQEHIDMLQASTKLVFEFLKLGFRPVIVVDTFSGDKINRYLETILEYNQKLSVKLFGLYTTDNELKNRLERRPIGEFRDFPISKKLNSDLLKWKHELETHIDTTYMLPPQTAAEIVSQLSKTTEDI